MNIDEEKRTFDEFKKKWLTSLKEIETVSRPTEPSRKLWCSKILKESDD
jgi:hypothetical protein